MAESKEEIKNLLMKVKEESEKVRLKLNIQKTMRPWTPEAGPLLLAPSPSQQRRQLASELTSAQASLLCFPCSVLSECLAGGTEV